MTPERREIARLHRIIREQCEAAKIPSDRYGAICHAGGRRIEITSPHQEWLDWALTTLYAAAAEQRPAEDNSQFGVGA
jgi:hypothetical protein